MLTKIRLAIYKVLDSHTLVGMRAASNDLESSRYFKMSQKNYFPIVDAMNCI